MLIELGLELQREVALRLCACFHLLLQLLDLRIEVLDLVLEVLELLRLSLLHFLDVLPDELFFERRNAYLQPSFLILPQAFDLLVEINFHRLDFLAD